MKWFRRTFLWASVGCLGATATATASAQQANWRQAAIPLAPQAAEVRPASNGITLGTPTAIAPDTIRLVNAFVPAKPGPSVVRAAMPMQGDEPKTFFLPRDVGPLGDLKQAAPFLHMTPAQNLQPPPKDKAKIFEVDPEKIAPPLASTPAPSEDRILILENGAVSGDEQGRSLFGLSLGGNRRFYGSAEALLWTTRGFHLPPLVTTASPFDPEDTRGALGFGTTRLLFGDTNALGGIRPGARFTAGYNLDPCGLCALEASFFFLTRRNENVTFDSNSMPVIGRPFFNINTGLQDRELTASPGIAPGDIFTGVGALQINLSTSLWGAELNSRWLLWRDCNFELTGLAGFRYLDLTDRLSITENITARIAIPGLPVRAGDQVVVFDRFDTHNRFFGGQIGVNAEWRRGPWSLDTRFKVGLGATQQSIDIDGSQRIASPDGRVQDFRGGLYALPTNIGHFSQTRFGVVPEVGIKVGYNLTDNIRVSVGYDFLYWNSVVRPGDQIDQSLDANIIPNSGGGFPAATQVRPVVPFRTSSYWAHGLNAGLEFRY